MSSILDALKKLEDEKAADLAPEDLDLDDDIAEEELIGPASRPASRSSSLTSPALLIGGMVLAVVLAAISAGTSVALLQSRAAPAQQAAIAPVPVATEFDDAVPMNTVDAGVPEAPMRRPLKPAELGFDGDYPDPELTAGASATMAQATVTTEPVAPIEEEHFEPLPDPASLAPVDDLRALPILSDYDRRRHGLPTLTINMLKAASEDQPRPSAMVNYQKVYVGYTIPGTRPPAILIGVDMRGIGIQVEGRRYYLPRGSARS